MKTRAQELETTSKASTGRKVWSWRDRRPNLVAAGFTITVGLALAATLIALQGYSPLPTLAAGLSYASGSTIGVARTFAWALPLYVATLGVGIAFRSGMFNIGAEGQIYAGAMAAAVLGAYLGPMASGLHIGLAMVAAGAAGAIIAGGLGWLRAAWGVDEVLSTLLSNYIIILAMAYLATGPLRDPTRQSGTTRPVADTAMFSELVPRTGLTTALYMVAILCVAVWWISEKSIAGYRWRMTGESESFAAAVGIHVSHARIASMMLSGALCGVGGGLLVSTSQGRFWTGIGTGIGWDAVLLALIGRARPVPTILWVTLYAFMRSAARGVEQVSDVPAELSLILISAVIIAAVARPGIFAVVGTLRERYSPTRSV